MKIMNYTVTFLSIFLISSFSLLFPIDYHFYTTLSFHLFKPSILFFQLFDLLYPILFSLSLTEIVSLYSFKSIDKKVYIKVGINLLSFGFIRLFFNLHLLLYTFLSALLLFISLLYVYEEVSFFNEKSTRYLDINVLYSLLLSAFTFCLYVLNCI